ncbi:hypothetical protein BJY24_001407 [Nocardia transvalensis]|uniref:Uncharacterized protein n=1 Tax=Nocardia transvalensis TaxID=37333 RepID=A0A7W9UHB1_9NOCA|nr:hypothetical protein [Nocardia transvalensis]
MRHTYTTYAVWAIMILLLAACVWFALALG